MTEIRKAARSLLASAPGEAPSSAELAERAMGACGRLTTHLSQLLGETGLHMLFSRSVRIATSQYPWLPPRFDQAALRAAMEQQAPESIVDAFAAILSTLTDLLKRLIGDGLVERLLNEVWPDVFVHDAKDIP